MVTGAHVDLSDESGTTALMWAAKFNNVQVMTYLMKAGAGDAILNFFFSSFKSFYTCFGRIEAKIRTFLRF